MRTSTGIRESYSDRMFLFFNYLVLAIILSIVLYPMIYIVSSSFSSGSAITSGRVWLWPVEPTLSGYRLVFINDSIWMGYKNSLIYMVTGTFINVVMTCMAAFPLSRKDFYGRKVIMLIFVFSMMFSGGLIPSYLVVRSLGMLNTIWAMIIPGAMGVYMVIIARTYFMSNIPNELIDAASLDGCGDTKFILKIALPLSKPIIAVMALMYAVGHWNSYFSALIYLNNPKLYPLQLILQRILILDSIETGNQEAFEMVRSIQLRTMMKYALIIIANAPLFMAYPFLQKYFVKGFMIGSLKG